LYNAAPGLERSPAQGDEENTSAEVDDDDPALGIVLLFVFARRAWSRPVRIDRKLDPRLVTLDTTTLLFFSSPNLVDDEGRKHGAASLSRCGSLTGRDAQCLGEIGS